MPVKKISKDLSMRMKEMYTSGQRIADIQRWLTASGLVVPSSTVCYHAQGKNRDRKKAPRVTNAETTLLVDRISEENDERSALRVKNTLQENHNLTVSESSIKKMRRRIGWKYGRVRAYPMIRDANKIKRVLQAQAWIDSGETFQDCIFTDESTVSLERFARFAFHKKGRITLKPRPKHPVKLHVWGAISRRGPGCIVVFEDPMGMPSKQTSGEYGQIPKQTHYPYNDSNTMYHSGCVDEPEPASQADENKNLVFS
ncbi:uncharacterized protein LOC142490728 [Ascaphus truei]|uniref:uncharacterized protein LOC142490728 n=1 Tax=Ascaphus truei TaxID=8439 RepID=UPI003F5A550A